MIQLGIIEDEPMVLDNLELFLQAQPEINVVQTANTVEDFISQFNSSSSINMILLDIGLPGMSGLEGIRPLKSLISDLDILMLTAYDDSDKIFKALCAGAVSYISKRTDLPTIKDALVTVNRGGAFMSPSIARKVIGHFGT